MSDLAFGSWRETVVSELGRGRYRDRYATEQSRVWIWLHDQPTEVEGWLVERNVIRHENDWAQDNITFYLFARENHAPIRVSDVLEYRSESDDIDNVYRLTRESILALRLIQLEDKYRRAKGELEWIEMKIQKVKMQQDEKVTP